MIMIPLTDTWLVVCADKYRHVPNLCISLRRVVTFMLQPLYLWRKRIQFDGRMHYRIFWSWWPRENPKSYQE
jgi:hypothetical protein